MKEGNHDDVNNKKKNKNKNLGSLCFVSFYWIVLLLDHLEEEEEKKLFVCVCVLGGKIDSYNIEYPM